MTMPASESPQRQKKATPFFPTPSPTSAEPDSASAARRRIVRVGVVIVVIGFLNALVGAILLGQGRGPLEGAGDIFHQVGKLTLLFGLVTLLIGFRWQPAQGKLFAESFDSEPQRKSPNSVRDLLDAMGRAEHRAGKPGAGGEGQPFVLPGPTPPKTAVHANELTGADGPPSGEDDAGRKQGSPTVVKFLIVIMMIVAAGCSLLTFDWSPRAEAHLFVAATALMLALSYGADAVFSRDSYRVFCWTAAVVCLLFLGVEVEVAVAFFRSRTYISAVPIALGVWVVPPIVGSFVRFLWDLMGAMLERMFKRK